MEKTCTQFDLNGDWQVTWREFHLSEFPSTNTKKTANRWCKEKAGWIPARVPGDVHDDACRAGLIQDPYIADLAEQCTWVTEKEWWYKREFTAPAQLHERCELVFKGIDTFSRIYLNGTLLGRTDNMFCEWRFDVQELLKTDGTNELMVAVEPVRNHLNAVDSENYHGIFNRERIFLRKAQCHFGWDWAPDCPGTGIYDDVTLEMGAATRLESVNIKTRLNGVVTFFIDLEHQSELGSFQDRYLTLEIEAPDGSIAASYTWETYNQKKTFVNITIEEPVLWWPNGKGESSLYNYHLRLTHGKGGPLLDDLQGRFGIRDVRLEEEPIDEDKLGFGFAVNGEPVYARGGNWIPLDAMTGRIPDEMYRHVLQLVKEAGFNMLRVWGGGIYEKEIFYDLCDELGIMVFQDFMFACQQIPEDVPGFNDSVTREVVYQIKRLRKHTSLVYWTGGNEHRDNARKPNPHGTKLHSEIIPGLVSTLDPDRKFHSGSPYSYRDSHSNQHSGDSHVGAFNQSTKKGGEGYRKTIQEIDVNFISEFSLHGACRAESFERYIPKEHHWPPNDIWNYHNTYNPYDSHDDRSFTEKQMHLVRHFLGEQENHHDFLKCIMSIHAAYMYDEFFGYRCKFPKNTGAMFWMLNDIWPSGCWSAIDWYGAPKAAYYAAARACKPVVVGIREGAEGRYELAVHNDSRKTVCFDITYGQESVKGVAKVQETCRVESAPCSTTVVCPDLEFNGDADTYLFAEAKPSQEGATTMEALCTSVTFFPDFWKDVPWPEPGLQMVREDLEEQDGLHRIAVKVSCSQYARMVHFTGPRMGGGLADGAPVYASDNFFDLRPGEEKTVILKSHAPIDSDAIGIAHWLDEWKQ